MATEETSPQLVTFGESMVQLVPTESGLLRHAARFRRHVAGAESNVAVALSRLGHATGWISRVGADEFGACVRAAIRGEGVDVSQVIEDPDAPTGVYFKERRRPGRTRVYYYRKDSAASRLAPGDLDPNYLARARFLLVTGITTALGPSCRKAVEHAIDVARVADVHVVLDPNVRRKLWSEATAREVLLELMGDVDTLLATREEVDLLADETRLEPAVRTLQERGPREVVVRLGAEGAIGFEGEEQADREAIEVETVETVGAGDAFNAGYLSGRMRGWDLARSLHLGTVLGGLAVTAEGDVEGLPTWKEVTEYLDGGPSPAR